MRFKNSAYSLEICDGLFYFAEKSVDVILNNTMGFAVFNIFDW